MLKKTICYAFLTVWMSCFLLSSCHLSKCPNLSARDSKEAFTIRPKPTVLAGSNVTYHCAVPRNERWRRQLAVPSNMYILTQNGYQLCQTQTVPANEYLSCTMNLNQVHPDNGGWSVCVLNQGQTNCLVGDARLKVIDPETALFPQVSLLSPKVLKYSRVGLPFHLFCQATGRPQPMITWMRDDVSIEEESGVVIRQYDKHTSKLIIMSLRLRHEGTYSCAASNILGVAYSTKESRLKLDPGPPVITLQPENQNITLQTNATLSCAAVGYPMPSVKWLKNGVIMDDSGIMERDKEGTTWLLLELKNIKKSDLGKYQCIASNEEGKDQSVAAYLAKEEISDTTDGKSQSWIEKVPSIYWLIACVIILFLLLIILICLSCIFAGRKQKITVITKSEPATDKNKAGSAQG